MNTLNKEQINYISNDLEVKGLKYEPLKQEMLDHICIDVESYLSDGYNFNEAYKLISKKANSNDLKQLEKQTFLLINLKYIFLRRLMLITIILLVISFIFKSFHIRGYFWTVDFSFIIISLIYLKFAVIFLKDKRNKILNPILGFISFGAVLLTFLPILDWLFDKLTGNVHGSYHVFHFAIIGFHLQVVGFFILYISKYRRTKIKADKRNYFIFIILTFLFTILMPPSIINFLGYHVPYLLLFAKVIFIICLFLAVPYLIFAKLLKRSYILSVVAIGIFISLNTIDKSYLFSSNFSKTHQPEIILKSSLKFDEKEAIFKPVGKNWKNKEYRLKKMNDSTYKCILMPTWKIGIMNYKIFIDKNVILEDSLLITHNIKEYRIISYKIY